MSDIWYAFWDKYVPAWQDILLQGIRIMLTLRRV